MGQKYDEVMATYLLLSYKRLELEGYTITIKPLPSAGPANSCSPSHPASHSIGCLQIQSREFKPFPPLIPTIRVC